MPRLSAALIQQASTLDPAENRERLGVIDEICSGEPKTQLVVLPEASACDFGTPETDIAVFAEPLDGPFVTRLTELAVRHGITVVAGMFERSEDPRRPYNTLVVVDAGGLRATYRKIHLYDSFGFKESERLLAGEIEPVIVDVEGVKLGLMTCYDLRFPELARALTDKGADVIVVPAAWVAGERKLDHWRTLVKARAIENTVYVAAAGQPAPRYSGHTLVVAPNGDVEGELEDGDVVLVSGFDTDVVAAARKQNPSLANRRL